MLGFKKERGHLCVSFPCPGVGDFRAQLRESKIHKPKLEEKKGNEHVS